MTAKGINALIIPNTNIITKEQKPIRFTNDLDSKELDKKHARIERARKNC